MSSSKNANKRHTRMNYIKSNLVFTFSLMAFTGCVSRSVEYLKFSNKSGPTCDDKEKANMIMLKKLLNSFCKLLLTEIGMKTQWVWLWLFSWGFFFFIINSTQLEQNKKIQHTTEVTTTYQIYSIQYRGREVKHWQKLIRVLKKQKHFALLSEQMERHGKMKTQ